jgi:hypothetical protein
MDPKDKIPENRPYTDAVYEARQEKHAEHLGARVVKYVETADGKRRQVATFEGAFVCSVVVGPGMGVRAARAKAFELAGELGWSPVLAPEWFRRVSVRPPARKS